MNRTEIALYWATESWVVPNDVSRETGLPEAECTPIVHEVERVRKLFKEAFEPLFRSMNGLQRPLSRELAFVDKYMPATDEGKETFEKFEVWARQAKVGDRREVTVTLGDWPGAEVQTFVCERID